MNAIYEGTIRHRRLSSRRHAFTHRIGLLYLDVDRVPDLLDGRLCRSRPGTVRFRRADYLGDPATPLGSAVRSVVHERTGWLPDGPIYILTQPRTFGHCFNPVSFYFCYGRDEQLRAVLAEVTNTPWGERHSYVLPRVQEGPVLRGEFKKRLHVSPFMGMSQSYRWRVSTPGPTLSVHIENHEADELAFDATLSLRREPLNRSALRAFTLRYPAGTLRVLALIYGHALVLRLKGVAVHARPSHDQTAQGAKPAI